MSKRIIVYISMLSLCINPSIADVVSSTWKNWDSDSGDNSWPANYDLAIAITTDASASDWTVRSLTVGANNNSADPSGRIWAFYTDNSGEIGSLVQNSEMTAITTDRFETSYVYTSSGFSLANNTTYWLVGDQIGISHGPDTVASGSPESGWSVGDTYKNYWYRSYSSTGGWSSFPINGKLMIKLEADAVPEPMTAGLFLLSGGGLLAIRRFIRI